MVANILEGLASAAVGAVIGAVLTATAQARVARHELERTDRERLLDRIEKLERFQATEDGRRLGLEEGRAS